MNMTKTKSFVCDEAMFRELQVYARKEGYLNVSEFIRDAIREKIQEAKNREAFFNHRKSVKQEAVV